MSDKMIHGLSENPFGVFDFVLLLKALGSKALLTKSDIMAHSILIVERPTPQTCHLCSWYGAIAGSLLMPEFTLLVQRENRNFKGSNAARPQACNSSPVCIASQYE